MARECPSLLAERSYASTILIAGLATEQVLVEVDCIAQPPSPRRGPESSPRESTPTLEVRVADRAAVSRAALLGAP
jgi:hypothetical protein